MMDCISINSSFEFRLVKYICPECKKIRSLKTPISSIKDNGLATVSISKGAVCQHSFLAEIGRDFKQRSSYVPDFTLELPIKDSTSSKKTRLNNIIPKLTSTNFKMILIKKAVLNLIFSVILMITTNPNNYSGHFIGFKHIN